MGEVRATIASWNAIYRPSAPAVASKLGLEPRKLNRLLRREGTNFIRLLEDAQYESAQQLLQIPPYLSYRLPGRLAMRTPAPFPEHSVVGQA